MRGPVLICPATARELKPAGPWPAAADVPSPSGRGPETGGGRILAVTGVGIPMTMARLLPLLRDHRPSLIVNIGLAGAYPGSGLAIGDLVAGDSEVFGDLGMETRGPEAFLPLRSMPWADPEYGAPLPLVTAPFLAPPPDRVREEPSPKTGKGCTVNACAGRKETGELRRRIFGADFESMEGAAVALAGSLSGVPVAELRAISNLASDRDMRPENLALALGNLAAYMRRWMGGRP